MTLKCGIKAYVHRWLKMPFHATCKGQALWGACAALGMPPAYIMPCFLIGLFVHRYVLTGVSNWKIAFSRAWWFHMGLMTVSLHWVVTALSVDWARFWWLSPLACFGLPAVLALFSAMGAACASQIRWGGLSALWAISVCYWSAEWARGHLFTGFPWHLYGYALTGNTILAQTSSLFGVYGLGFCVVLMVFLGVAWAQETSMFSLKAAMMCGIVLSGLTLYGAWHLLMPSWNEENRLKPFHIRVVQPNIPQDLKWNPDEAKRHLMTLVRLSRSSTYRPIDALIWPETAIPYAIPTTENRLPWGDLLRDQARIFMVGAVEIDTQDQHKEPIYYNSLMLLDDTCVIRARYRKKHLVPFGEFIPWRHWLILPSVASDRADYRAGSGPVTLKIKDMPAVSPLICYDIIFGGEVVVREGLRPQWLLNITNDAWFVYGWGPQQHLHLARVRAIEEGMPLVRAANTGISAIIDAQGRILRSLPFQTQGILDVILPCSLTPTLFRIYGHQTTIMLIMIIGLMTVLWDQLSLKRIWMSRA